MISYIFKSIFKNFRRNLLITIINIIGLSLSFTVGFIIFGHIQNQLKFDKDVKSSDRLYRLETNWASMPPFIGHVLTQELSLYKTTRLNFKEELIINYNKKESLIIDNVVYADSSFFDVFPFELIKGNRNHALRKPFQIYLTETEVHRIFGEKDPIGESILIDNEFNFQVAGIIKDIEYSHLKFDAVISMVSIRKMSTNKDVLEEFDGWDFPTYILVPENRSKYEAEEEINKCLFNYHYKYFIERFNLRNYDHIYFATNISNEAGTIHGNQKANSILFLISVFIIVLAIINYINLTTANAYKRYKWIGVNRIVGATKSRIIIHFLIETIIVCLISLWVSILIIEITNPLINRIFSIQIYLPDIYSFHNIFHITLGIVLLGIISGLYPALVLSSYLPVDLIRKYKVGVNKKFSLRNVLTVFQFIIAIVLIISTILIYNQFRFISNCKLGFKPEQMVTLRINNDIEKNLNLFRDKLLEHPEIKNISYTMRIPGNEWGSWCCTSIDGKEHKYFNQATDPSFLETFNIKLKEGRNFNWNNKSDFKGAFILNETAVKEYGIENPTEKYVGRSGNGITGPVIGVVEDFHFRGFHHKVDPVIIYWSNSYLRYVNVLINSNQVENSISIIKDVWEDLYPAFPFKYTFLDDTFNQQYKSDKLFGRLVCAFSFIACFIACIGILGFSFFYLNQQVKNIGIRKVHGANFWLIVRLLLTDISKRIVISFFIAIPLIYYAISEWLKGFAYKIDITVWPFIYGGLITIIFVLLTVFWQTLKTARNNPVESLRYE